MVYVLLCNGPVPALRVWWYGAVGNPLPVCVVVWCMQVEVYWAKAYRLEPLTSQGLYSLDGEPIDYGPIQVHIHMRERMAAAPGVTASSPS